MVVLSAQPNLHLRFLQLWGVIFQPQAHLFEPSVKRQAPTGLLNNLLLGSLSLLIPQAATLARHGERFAMHDTRIAFTETSSSSRPDESSLSITQLVKSLSEKATKSMVQSHCLVLFTSSDFKSDQLLSSPDPVLGIYFPGPLILLDEYAGEPVYSNSLASSSDCMLLQLWPELRFAKWKGDDINLVEMLSGDMDSAYSSKITQLALGRVAMGSPEAEKKLLSELPYWIGAPHSGPNSTNAAESSGFEPFSAEACEIKISNAAVHIFTVSGDACRRDWTPLPAVQDLSVYRRDEKEILVAGEELKARIEGFGSK
ncbi:hypothetical protein DL98DRAFT_538411 [Cadophora sp. DSE1049]|nr:hypothetical protein DL98DRAFT_538411 [Cadophora sp. DSE1049]